MEATVEPTQIETPIDAMFLIHKALRAEAGRVEEAVNQLEMGGSFKPFQRVFYRWAMALGYHVVVEDQYLTPHLVEAGVTLATETEQQCVIDMLEGLQTYMHEELGRMIVIPRTQRQLRSRVIALRIAQDDLLEDEEASVLPVARQRMSAPQQLDLIRHLLIDDEAEEQTEMLEWVAQELNADERQMLAALHERFKDVALA